MCDTSEPEKSVIRDYYSLSDNQQLTKFNKACSFHNNHIKYFNIANI